MNSVAVMVAYHKAGPWVREAVESILAQTYQRLKVYVVNDGDPEPPWPMLKGIRSKRLIRFDLPENRGRYFADAVVLAATDCDYWAMMDPDDRSEPDRLSTLVPLAQEHGMALAPHLLYPGSYDAKPKKRDTRIGVQPGELYRYHAGWASAVTSTERLRQAGGFHAGMRTTYDVYITRAAKLIGPYAVHDKPMVHKLRRSDSLMTAKETKPGSPGRTADQERLKRLWGEAWALHQKGESIAPVVQRDIAPAIRKEVAFHAARLRELQ